MQVYFNANGEWQKTITILNDNDISKPIWDYIDEEYSEHVVAEFRKVETLKGDSFYQLVLEDEGDEKVKLKFTLEGELIE